MCLCTLLGTSIRLQLYLSTNPQRCKEKEGQKTGRKRTCGTSLERGTKNPGGITAFSTKETYVIFLAKMLKIWQFKARDGEETAGRPGGCMDKLRGKRYGEGGLWGGNAEMEEHALNGEYISALRNGVLSYGGSQRWLDSGAPIPPWSGGIRPLPAGGRRLPAVHNIGREGEIGTLIIPGIPGRDPVCLEFCGVTPAAPSRLPARRTELRRCSPARGSSCPRRRSSAG